MALKNVSPHKSILDSNLEIPNSDLIINHPRFTLFPLPLFRFRVLPVCISVILTKFEEQSLTASCDRLTRIVLKSYKIMDITTLTNDRKVSLLNTRN